MLPDAAGPGVLLSATREVEPGARVMLVRARGLFRLDVVVEGDTLRTVVRNLSAGELRTAGAGDYGRLPTIAYGGASAYDPGSAQLRFELGSGDDVVRVAGTVATLQFHERGTVQVTGQLIVRSGPAAPDAPAS